ncbi:hypothetical protein DVH05_024538 [Phytophthora capsici]|nr:hypothetical protein DVH05_024538 [Phytophthora capsici]
MIPGSVRDAIHAYEPPDGFIVVPPRRSEKSVIFSYGVRLVKAPEDRSTEPDPASPAVWMCLAGDVCREKDVSFPLSSGKTSAATKHLKKAHDITSERTESAQEKRRSRDEELDRLRRSQMFREDPARVYVLMETLRIVNNNLPYRLGEYEESISIRELVIKNSMQATINAKVVAHSIVELYASTKRVIEDLLASNRIGTAPSFSVVADFWSSKVTTTKYLGLRVYMVDENYQFRSVLLGTRHFNPHYGERDGGTRGPFQRWIADILRDFGLTRQDLFGATSDAGQDVKWMMRDGLKLSWHWCVPHMTNAATKSACGMVADAGKSKNPAMTDLVRRIVKTVYTVKHVETMGSLFEELYRHINCWIIALIVSLGLRESLGAFSICGTHSSLGMENGFRERGEPTPAFLPDSL